MDLLDKEELYALQEVENVIYSWQKILLKFSNFNVIIRIYSFKLVSK